MTAHNGVSAADDGTRNRKAIEIGTRVMSKESGSDSVRNLVVALITYAGLPDSAKQKIKQSVYACISSTEISPYVKKAMLHMWQSFLEPRQNSELPTAQDFPYYLRLALIYARHTIIRDDLLDCIGSLWSKVADALSESSRPFLGNNEQQEAARKHFDKLFLRTVENFNQQVMPYSETQAKNKVLKNLDNIIYPAETLAPALHGDDGHDGHASSLGEDVGVHLTNPLYTNARSVHVAGEAEAENASYYDALSEAEPASPMNSDSNDYESIRPATSVENGEDTLSPNVLAALMYANTTTSSVLVTDDDGEYVDMVKSAAMKQKVDALISALNIKRDGQINSSALYRNLLEARSNHQEAIDFLIKLNPGDRTPALLTAQVQVLNGFTPKTRGFLCFIISSELSEPSQESLRPFLESLQLELGLLYKNHTVEQIPTDPQQRIKCSVFLAKLIRDGMNCDLTPMKTNSYYNNNDLSSPQSPDDYDKLIPVAERRITPNSSR